jgi:nucleotide-binding universal stress UspA family protein
MYDVQTGVRFKNILFTTDFSPAAAAALPYAASLARAYGAQLWALHVAAPLVNPMTEPSTWTALLEADEVCRKTQREQLAEAMRGLNPQILIIEGDLWSTLDAAIEKNKIDLIVMGTRGRSGFGKLLLGSVTEEVFRNVSCPVLTVGPHTPASGRRPETISNILFATALTPKSMAAASYAISLVHEYRSHLTLLHVIEDRKGCELVQWPELERASIHLLQGIVPPGATTTAPAYIVKHGDPAERILEVANQRNADLIVLGAHRAHGVPGAATHLPMAIAHKIVVQAGCAVLTVRD